MSWTYFSSIFLVPQQHHKPPARTGAAGCHQGTDEHTQTKRFYNQPCTESQCCWKLVPVQKKHPSSAKCMITSTHAHLSDAAHETRDTRATGCVVGPAGHSHSLELASPGAVWYPGHGGLLPGKLGELEAVLTLLGVPSPSLLQSPPKERGHKQNPHRNTA